MYWFISCRMGKFAALWMLTRIIRSPSMREPGGTRGLFWRLGFKGLDDSPLIQFNMLWGWMGSREARQCIITWEVTAAYTLPALKPLKAFSALAFQEMKRQSIRIRNRCLHMWFEVFHLPQERKMPVLSDNVRQLVFFVHVEQVCLNIADQLEWKQNTWMSL